MTHDLLPRDNSCSFLKLITLILKNIYFIAKEKKRKEKLFSQFELLEELSVEMWETGIIRFVGNRAWIDFKLWNKLWNFVWNKQNSRSNNAIDSKALFTSDDGAGYGLRVNQWNYVPLQVTIPIKFTNDCLTIVDASVWIE